MLLTSFCRRLFIYLFIYSIQQLSKVYMRYRTQSDVPVGRLPSPEFSTKKKKIVLKIELTCNDIREILTSFCFSHSKATGVWSLNSRVARLLPLCPWKGHCSLSSAHHNNFKAHYWFDINLWNSSWEAADLLGKKKKSKFLTSFVSRRCRKTRKLVLRWRVVHVGCTLACVLGLCKFDKINSFMNNS